MTDRLCELVYTLAKEMRRSMDERLSKDGVSFASMQVLLMIKKLGHNEGVTQEKIVQEMNINKSNVSRNLRNLQSTGHILLEREVTDARKHTIRITPYGERQLETLYPVMQEVSDQMEGGLLNSETEQVIRYLKKAVDNLQQGR